MNVTSGSRLGPYEIVSRLGAGGMGEVWSARDTRLDRRVAVKILPAELAHDAQFRLRFEREAKTISQLSHPNICTLFDVGDDFLVMELLEGETLADRIVRGPMPMPEVLRYGLQIAEALGKAHRMGIVHRDLKPANVMITKAGAKLLDFGLAKSAVEIVNLDGATQQKALTQEGTILGTFQYMAPEQLEGQEADARTDIFALGALLYEMATGRHPFEGKTKTSLIAQIVSADPKPLRDLAPLTPPAFEHVVARCLKKDPDERWQTAQDIAEELRWIAEAGSQAGVAAPVTARRKNRERAAWTLAAIAAVAVLAASFVAWRNRTSEPARVMRFSAPNTISARPTGTYGVIAVSPDGREIVYAGFVGTTKMLFRRAIDQFEARPIAGTDGAVQPFFSPDGKWVGFFARHRLMKVALSGGQPIELAHAAESRGADWLEGDTIVFCPFYYGGIERVSASGGAPVAVTKVDRAAGERSHRWPHALPGGKVILYSVGLGSSWDNAKIVAQRLDTGERKVILNGGCDARYVPTGHLVYVRGTSLYAVPFDVDALEVRGEAVEVTPGVANHSAGGAEYAFSRNGMLVYFSPGVGGDEGGKLALLNRRGEPVAGMVPPFPMVTPRFSPDGNVIVGGRDWDIVTFDLTRGTSTRISHGPRAGWAIWSADGSRIFYSSERSGPWQIYSRAADASDEERRVSDAKSTDAMNPIAMLADGSEILVRIDAKDTGTDLGLMTMDGRVSPLLRTEADEAPDAFSPDGRWIAYLSDESGRDEVYVRPKGQTAGRWQISNEGGSEARWVRQDEIVYMNGTKLMSVAVKTEPTFSAAAPQLLFERNLADFDISRDGRVLIVEAPDPSASTGRLNVVVNWFEEIRKR